MLQSTGCNMGDEEILYIFYKYIEWIMGKRMMSREKEIAILAYKLGKGEIDIKELIK
jgi:hypothetical protein